MGKKAKEHRKKVAKRNARIQQDKYRMQKLYEQTMGQMMEQFKAQYQTETGTQEMDVQIVEEVPQTPTTDNQ